MVALGGDFDGVAEPIFDAQPLLIEPPGRELPEAFLAEPVGPPVPIPGDCLDGFLGAFWRRPEAYLDPAVRAGMSSFARMVDADDRLERLRADIFSGALQRRHADLPAREALDIGYRLVVARRSERWAT